MPSETDLCNDALGQIGATRITSIDDPTINANFCKTFYPPLRRAMIMSNHWNFARARAELAKESIGPIFEFAFAYGLPANFLKIVEYNGANLDPALSFDTTGISLYALRKSFRIEGQMLLSNDDGVKIVYIQDVENPDVWNPLFYQALAAELASKLASAITRDSRRAQQLLEMAEGRLFPLAGMADGQQGSVEPIITDDLLWGR